MTNPDEFHVAIPSRHRADLLARKTLPLLFARNVEPAQITVFVHEDDETVPNYERLADEYQVSLVVTSAGDVSEQRRAILDHYPPGTALVQMDDDVSDIVHAADPKTLQPVPDLGAFFAEAFARTAEEGLHVWGLTAVVNPFFMRDTVTTDLKFCIGSTWGCFTRPGHPVHDTSVRVKEDYELSLRAWWYDGGIVRFNGYAPKADHYKAPGGCQDYRSAEISREAADALVAAWPGLVRINERRKSSHAEVLLARKKRHDGNSPETPTPGGVG